MALTKSDLNKVDDLLDKKLEIKLTDKLDKQEQKLENKLTEFKSEFFEKVDPILKEVTTAREARTLVENRLEALEEIHRTGSHSLATI